MRQIALGAAKIGTVPCERLQPPQSAARGGLTLVELILATGLSALVLVAVFTAMEVQLRAFDRAVRRADQTRLAHALLRRIAADLRGVLAPAASADGGAAGGFDLGLDSGDPFDVFAQVTGMGWDGVPGETASGPIGLRGDFDRLRIDVVRAVPAHGGVSAAAFWLDGVPSPAESGIRTIEYFVVPPDPSLGFDAGARPDDALGGLVRREMIEPVAAWASQLGLLDAFDPAAPPLAQEVVAVEFRYHDGNEWLEAWDTSITGALPRAVEITLLFASEDLSSSDAAAGTFGLAVAGFDEATVRHRLVVHLPAETPGTSTTTAGRESLPADESDRDESDPGDAP